MTTVIVIVFLGDPLSKSLCETDGEPLWKMGMFHEFCIKYKGDLVHL